MHDECFGESREVEAEQEFDEGSGHNEDTGALGHAADADYTVSNPSRFSREKTRRESLGKSNLRICRFGDGRFFALIVRR